jgi:hypothetical protein
MEPMGTGLALTVPVGTHDPSIEILPMRAYSIFGLG